jgi:oxidoreductase AflY
MIHLGCAIEFQQPSLVAEALAAACVHENWPKTFLVPSEEYVRSTTREEVQSSSLLHILDSLRHDPAIASGVKDTDPFNKIPNGFLKRVTPEQLVPYLGQFQVKPEPEDLQRRMSDIMYTSAYKMSAAQRPGKREAMDFVLLHSATLAVFYPAILAQDWLSDYDKSRLLEAKAGVDAVMYAGCRCSVLYPSRIVDYVPRRPGDGGEELFHRDESHAVKLIRAPVQLGAAG